MSFFSLHHLISLLHDYGPTVIGIVVALESFGVPLPGESLLIAGAIIAATTLQVNIVLVVLAAAIGAILGQQQVIGLDAVSGSAVAPLRTLYRTYQPPTRLRRALFRRHGVKVIVASRFVVLLRTLAALLAGANRMPWWRFMAANVIGSVAWAAFYGVGAYALGHEAKHLAGPVAIAVGAAVVLVSWQRRCMHAIANIRFSDTRFRRNALSSNETQYPQVIVQTIWESIVYYRALVVTLRRL